MARPTVARHKEPTKPTLGREQTVRETDFAEPDTSVIGMALQEVAAQLALLDNLHSEALQIEYSPISSALGMDRKALEWTLRDAAFRTAATELARARAALHDLFREVQLKATAVA